MKRKLLLLLAVGLLALAVSAFAVHPAAAGNPSQDPNVLKCVECHSEVNNSWAKGPHARPLTCAQCHPQKVDPDKLNHKMPLDKGVSCASCHTSGYNPKDGSWMTDGITCEACHNPIPADHPNQTMPIARTAQDCGRCHTTTYQEWKLSQHGKDGLQCNTCHNSHSTDLRSADAAKLCETCHQQPPDNFIHEKHTAITLAKHGKVALACPDCHLSQEMDPTGMANLLRDHSFRNNVAVCKTCHDGKTPLVGDTTAAAVEPKIVAQGTPVAISGVTTTPGGLNTIQMIIIAVVAGGLVGLLISGMGARAFSRVQVRSNHSQPAQVEEDAHESEQH
jgi:hypothetical protein